MKVKSRQVEKCDSSRTKRKPPARARAARCALLSGSLVYALLVFYMAKNGSLDALDL
jgi:hypothetical protein